MNKKYNIILISLLILSLNISSLFCQDTSGHDLKILGGSNVVNTQIIQMILFESDYDTVKFDLAISGTSNIIDSRVKQLLIQYSNEDDKIFLEEIAKEILEKSQQINDKELKSKLDKALELRRQFEQAASIAKKAIDVRSIDETKSLMLIHKACKLTKNRFSLLVQLRREWVENMSPYQNIVLLKNNKSTINCLAISNDDRLLVAGSNDGIVYLINLEENTIITTTRIKKYGDGSMIQSVDFSPDNKIAVGTTDGQIVIFDKNLNRISSTDSYNSINFLKFTNSNTLYFCPSSFSGYSQANFFEVDLKFNKKPEIKISLEETYPHGIRKNFLIGREANYAYLWDITEQKQKYMYQLDEYEKDGSINNQLVTIDINQEEEAVIALRGGIFYLVDKLNNVKTKYKGHQQSTEKLCFFENGNLIVSGGYDGELIIWDKMGRDLHHLKAHKNKINDILVANNDSFIISADESGVIRKWSTSFNNSNFPETEYNFSLDNQITPSPRHKINDIVSLDKETVLTANSDGSISKWKRYRQAPIKEFKNKHKGHVLSIDKSSDGKYFVSGGEDKTLKLYDTQFNELKSTNLKSPVNEVLFLNSTTYLGVTDNGVVSINHIKDGSTEIIAHDKEIFTINKNQNGQFIVGSWDGTATLWDSQGMLLNSFLHNVTGDHKVTSVTIHPSNNYYLTGGNYGYVKIWNKKFEYIDEVLVSKEYSVLDLEFSSDGKYLLSSDSGNLIKLWDFPTFFDKTIRDKEPLLSWDNTKTWERYTYGIIKSVSFFYSLDTILVAGGDRSYGIHLNLIEVLDKIYNEKYSDIEE